MPKITSDTVLNIAETSSNYIKSLLFIKTFSPHTLKAYTTDLTQAFLLQNFGKFTSIDKNISFELHPGKKSPLITSEQLLQLARNAQSRWGTLSLSSRNRKAATLKSFFKWLYEKKIIEKNLAHQITCPKVPKKLPHFLSLDEALHLVRHLQREASKSQQGQRTLLLTLLLYGGGLRVSEACQLKIKNIYIAKGQIKIMGKGQKERICPLPLLAIEALKKELSQKTSPDHSLHDSLWGAPLNPRSAWKMIRDAGVSANLLKPLSPHALRHSFATHILSSGANLRTLQELLGHQSLQATEKYTHLGIDELAKTLEDFHPLNKNSRKA